MLSAIAFVALTSRTEVADYFPLVTGTSWTYEVSGAGATASYEDSVGNGQQIGGKEAFPIVTKLRGKVDGSTFYRIEGDTVFLVAFDQNRPLAAPYPVLKFGPGKNDWNFDGETQWLGASAPLSMKGRVRKISPQDVLGTKREAIEVTVDALIGPKDKPNLRSNQVSVYAKGVGLIELKDTMTVKSSKEVTVKRLTAFQEGGS